MMVNVRVEDGALFSLSEEELERLSRQGSLGCHEWTFLRPWGLLQNLRLTILPSLLYKPFVPQILKE